MDGADHLLHHSAADEDEPSSSGISCSICLDTVSDNGARSTAKLQCGHQFHLDCIGSAFNMKGAMQCPNCRKVEKGQWLYANGSNRVLPEMSMDDWIPDEDIYDHLTSFSEMQYRLQWCPYELGRVGPPFEEVESPSTTYYDPRGHHSVYAEQTAASSVAHSYVAYVGQLPPNASRSNESIDDTNFNHHWNGLSGRHDIISTHAFPAINFQYHTTWGRGSPPFSISSTHINNVDPASVPLPYRSSNGEPDTRTRSTSLHPIMFGNGSGPSGGSSFVSSLVPRHPGSNARTNERIHSFHRQQSSSLPGIPSPIIHGIRRFDSPRGLPIVVPAPPQRDHSGGLVILPPNSSSQNSQEAENPMPNHYRAWEREHLPPFQQSFDGWGSFHHNAGGGPNLGNRSGSFWHGHS
ncbi:E3 ubiquitin-protein ligase RFI2 [Mercurialis annua]|uniref:E3 ubiquitin-protein ligase RFI2 n=1 Tax=Mercurialis annua TaxID=3986 RepID=UPI002161049F|nr:E3 ubiquitin-protein ligase RFI2 [Mercurialis annua]